MPVHLAPLPPPVSPVPELSTEMPPPLIQTEIFTQAPPIDQFGMMLFVATIIIAGVAIFVVLRRRKK